MSKKEIKNNTMRVMMIGSSMLIPGMNSINGDDYAVYKAVIKEKHELGELTDLSEDEDCDFAEGLLKYDEKKAVALAETCNDIETLEGWLKDEKRKKVVASINKQLKALNALIAEANEKKDNK